MEAVEQFVAAAANAAFGPITIALILGTGLFLTFGLRFITVRRFLEVLRMLVSPKLRTEAKAQLGNQFDIKTFHDEVLNGGAMPLDLLQERVERWIKTQAPQNASAVKQ